MISAAATGNEQVKALVYFNGWMPDEGENIQQLLENFEGSLVGPSIRPVPFTGPDGSHADLYFLDPAAFHAASRRRRRPRHIRRHGRGTAAVERCRLRRAVRATGLEGRDPVLVPARQRGQGDPAALQRFMAERANAAIVEEVSASHASMCRSPRPRQPILQATDATAPALSGT